MQIFKDTKGQYSAMRVMSFLALFIGAFLSFSGSGYEVVLIWVVGAFAPKALQKFAEK